MRNLLIMQERFSENMRKRIIRITALLTVAVLILSAMPVFAAEPPAWLQKLEGGKLVDTRDEESEQKQAELEKWQAKKREMKVPILLYHHITNDEFSDWEAISLISPKDFRLHMTAIKVHFTPISLREYYNYVACEDGSVDIPDNPIIVTFDDGYLSNYEIAYPILKELEIPATIFVVTDTVGAVAGEGKVNNSHFTWEQAKEMEESGLIEIQSHTVNHLKMTSLNHDEMIRQLRKSKYDIEKNLGRECDMIAYPYGDYNEGIKNAARAAGFKMQVLVDNKVTEEEYDVNVPSEGAENIVRMTIAGYMGNVNVIDIIRRTMSKKVIK